MDLTVALSNPSCVGTASRETSRKYGEEIGSGKSSSG